MSEGVAREIVTADLAPRFERVYPKTAVFILSPRKTSEVSTVLLPTPVFRRTEGLPAAVLVTVTWRRSRAEPIFGQKKSSVIRYGPLLQRISTRGSGAPGSQRARTEPPPAAWTPSLATRTTAVAAIPEFPSNVRAERLGPRRSGSMTRSPTGVAPSAAVTWTAAWMNPLPRKK